MTEARVLERFLGVSDNAIYPRYFEVGEVIYGSLAKSEIESGRAVSLAKKPPRTKEQERTLSLPQDRASQKKTVKRSRAKQKSSQ